MTKRPSATCWVGVRLNDDEMGAVNLIVRSLETPRRSGVTKAEAIRAAIRELRDVIEREGDGAICQAGHSAAGASGGVAAA